MMEHRLGAICAHGHLARQCELCDRDREIETLREQLADAERASREAWRFADDANAERAKLRGFLELIATPMRPDGTWNRDREACRQIAQSALDSEQVGTPFEPKDAERLPMWSGK